MNKIITIILSIFSLTVFAQSDYYYYKGQRIPLTINPKKVNIISMTNGPQYAPSVQPSSLPSGLEVESVISDNPYNMCIIKNNTNNPNLLNNYVNSTINPNYNLILPCYYSYSNDELLTTNNIYVKLRQLSDISSLHSMASHYKLQIIEQNQFMPLWHVVSITNQTQYKSVEMANILYETGLFLAVEPEFIFSGTESISWDENVYEQWGLYNAINPTIDINASSAWNYATGRGVKIAITDDVFDLNHEDLIDNLSEILNNDDNFNSDHGTHVAGIAAATRNNGKHIVGVAPDATILAISYLPIPHGIENATSIKYANAINIAVLNGADIINCSWKNATDVNILTDAIDNAIENGRNGKGCVIVKSAGNNGENDSIINKITFPGDYRSEILTVGAISRDGTRAEFSSYGESLDVVAPGQDILSTYRNNTVGYMSGTSMAAPYVSGIAALILELNPDLTGQQVRDIIEQSTIKVGNVEYRNTINRPNGTWHIKYGYGLVDALKAVQNTPRKQIEY